MEGVRVAGDKGVSRVIGVVPGGEVRKWALRKDLTLKGPRTSTPKKTSGRGRGRDIDPSSSEFMEMEQEICKIHPKNGSPGGEGGGGDCTLGHDIRYPEVKTQEDGDVLDLCVRKEPAAGRNINENGYRKDLYVYPCETPKAQGQTYREDEKQRSPPTEERWVPRQQDPLPVHTERIHPGGTSPTCSQAFPVDPPPPASRLIPPLPPAIPPITNRNGKPTRPFKAYPKDFLALATSEGLLDDSNKRYMEFRRQFLTQLHATTNLSSNKNMKRPVQSVSPNQLPSSSGDSKDQAYWERRKKNNEAAKKSRDARRAKEDEIAIRAAFLERENVRLKLELASLRSETDRLRCMLYSG